jgi:hypothetical protein
MVGTGRVKAPITRAAHSASRTIPQITLKSDSRRRNLARPAVAKMTIGLSSPEFARMMGWRRSLAGQARPEIVAFLAAEAQRAFDRLEPSLRDYCVKPGP